MSAMISAVGFFRANIESQGTVSSLLHLTAIKHVADDKFSFSTGQQTDISCMQHCQTAGKRTLTSLLLIAAFNLTAQQ